MRGKFWYSGGASFSVGRIWVFSGHAVLEGGHHYPNELLGLQMDIDEVLAGKLMDPEKSAQSFFLIYSTPNGTNTHEIINS
jgi:hypothetical protein